MYKKILTLLLSVAVMMTFMPMTALAYDLTDVAMDAQEIQIGEEVSLTSSPQSFMIAVPGPGTLKITGSYGYDFEVHVANMSGSVDEDIWLYPSSVAQCYKEYQVKTEDYFFITTNGAVGRKLTSSFEEKQANDSFENAEALDIPMDESITIDTATTKAEYYVIKPSDKSHYQFTANDGSYVRLYCKDKSGEYELIDMYTNNYDYSSTAGCQEQYADAYTSTPIYMQVYGKTSQYKGSVTIKRTDFKEIKTFKFPSSTISVGGHKKITLNVGGLTDYESRITYKMVDPNGKEVHCYECASEMENFNERHIITVGDDYTCGVYKLTATTSEGKKATATIKLAPSKFKIKGGTTSQGTSSSSTIHWQKQSGVDKYYIYLLKDGKYTKVGSTSTDSYTIKNLKSNKTYSFKIAAVKDAKDFNGNTVHLIGAKSDTWKFVTAPSVKPVITALSAGSTTYHPKKWVPGTAGHYDAGGVWHSGTSGYYTEPSSSAPIKITMKSGQGYDRYTNTYSAVHFKSGSTVTYSYSGKISSRKQAVKVRGVKTLSSYNSYAIGPWSAEKTVSVKAAK